MKPVVVDTSLWVEWLRGYSLKLRQALQGRFVWMSPIVATKLGSGARSRESLHAINTILQPFERNHFRLAGETLARLKGPASPKLGDALIAVSARKIGAELWPLNAEDFEPLGRQLDIAVINPH